MLWGQRSLETKTASRICHGELLVDAQLFIHLTWLGANYQTYRSCIPVGLLHVVLFRVQALRSLRMVGWLTQFNSYFEMAYITTNHVRCWLQHVWRAGDLGPLEVTRSDIENRTGCPTVGRYHYGWLSLIIRLPSNMLKHDFPLLQPSLALPGHELLLSCG